MSKIHLLNEISTVVKMASGDFDEVKLQLYLDDLLSNYQIVEKTISDHENDTEEYIKLYLNNMRLENMSEITMNNYRYELNRFRKFMNKPVAHITTADIRKYLSSFENLKASTISSKLTVLKSFFSWLVREEIIIRNPTSKIRTPKQPKRIKDGLTIEELEIVRESCITLRQRALIELFYSTGCRLSELSSLNRSSINWQDMSIRVIGKGDKERKVYLSYKALIHLKRYLKSRKDNCEALFVTERRPIRRMTNRGIQFEIDKIEKTSGITKPLTPHIMRHTFATLSMDAGIELADLQHLLGHSSPSTTLCYAPVSEERKRNAFKKYHVQ